MALDPESIVRLARTLGLPDDVELAIVETNSYTFSVRLTKRGTMTTSRAVEQPTLSGFARAIREEIVDSPWLLE